MLKFSDLLFLETRFDTASVKEFFQTYMQFEKLGTERLFLQHITDFLFEVP